MTSDESVLVELLGIQLELARQEAEQLLGVLEMLEGHTEQLCGLVGFCLSHIENDAPLNIPEAREILKGSNLMRAALRKMLEELR